jgi:hypothetical protein
VPAHDAAVAGGVGQLDGQQRQLFAAAGLHQRAGRFGAQQGHVAVEDQRDAVGVVQHGHGLLHRVAGAQLRHLAHEDRPAGRGRGFDLFGPVAGDHHGAIGTHACSRVQNMLQ